MSTRALALAALLLPLLAVGAKQSAIVIPTFIDVSNLTVVEGSSGMTEFKVNIMLVNGGAPVEVDVSARPDTADASDFVFMPVHLTLMPGNVVTVTGSVVGDRRYEPSEQFFITVSASNGLAATPNPGVIMIIDDDLDQAPHIIGKALAVAEGSAGWRTLEIPLSRDGALDEPLSVSFMTSGGNPVKPATPWGDYRSTSGIATFAAGQDTAVIPVEINGDTTWEADTTFMVEIVATGGNAIVVNGSIDVTLTNDDAATRVTIQDVRTDEGQKGRHPVTLRASFEPSAPPNVSVLVQVVGGTARAGEDFEGQMLHLVPPPGATSVTFATMIIGDMTPECDEGVVVTYQAMGTGDDTMKEAKLLIVDDDGPPTTDAGGCPDPFATRSVPVEPAPDAAAPPPREAGAGLTDARAEGPAPAAGGCGCGLGGGGRASWSAALALALAALRRRRRAPTSAATS